MPVTVTDAVVAALKAWLGDVGIQHFRDIRDKHGRIDAVWMDGKLPHPVHFREGMQVRNCMRGLDDCSDWNDHDFDNNWVHAVECAIEEE